MKRYKILPYISLAGFIFSSNMVFSRFSLGQFNAIAYVSLRLLIGALGYMILMLFRKGHSWPRSWKFWLNAGFYGILANVIPMTGFVSGLNYLSSGVSSMLVTLNPILIVLLAQVFLDEEPLTRKKILGSILAIIGAGAILVQGESGLADVARADWRGYAWVMLGVVSVAFSFIYARKFLSDGDVFEITAVRVLVAALVMIPIVFLTVGYDVSKVDYRGLIALLYSGTVGTIFVFLLEFYNIKRFGATAASQTAYFVPIMATILGVLFLGEQVTPVILGGMACVLIGLRLMN
ncbi:MAG: DMT family transporter [Anaerolineaceae bacterium]|nr:DMT family transporter [Anaerolineaceae bacterium]